MFQGIWILFLCFRVQAGSILGNIPWCQEAVVCFWKIHEHCLGRRYTINRALLSILYAFTLFPRCYIISIDMPRWSIHSVTFQVCKRHCKQLCGGMDVPCQLEFNCSNKEQMKCLKDLLNLYYYQYTRPNRKSASSKHMLSGPQMTDSGLLMHYQPYSWLVLASSSGGF